VFLDLLHQCNMITGPSVHNQCIKRLWRDMHQCVTKLHYQLFYHLEETGLFDPLDELRLYVLHYVFAPRINKALSEFKDAWNPHAIRTQHNKSPFQLFTAGLLLLRHSGHTAMDFFSPVEDAVSVCSSTLNQVLSN